MRIDRLFWLAIASSVLMLIAVVVDGLRATDNDDQTADTAQKDLAALGLDHGRLRAVR